MGSEAEIRCAECNALMRSVPAGEVDRTLTELELSLDCATDICPHCGKANVISGFSMLMAYTCRECGKLVRLSDDPGIERLFGSED